MAMFILGILALAFLPLLVQGMKLSVTNATLATATQYVQREMEEAGRVDTCEGLELRTGTTTTDAAADARGVSYVIETVAETGTCSMSYPNTVRLSVEVSRADDADSLLAEATTLILVVAAN
ncbi:hypothetical protein [Marisediminicola sp. LYQ85]|uniref:hypothetical protein n=1 Tax=Marisediminicola sp. LYQ85 TaxID=3391062 RepID=UPI0039831502